MSPAGSGGPVWVGTSWKMTGHLAAARAYARELGAARLPDGVQVFVLPASTALATVRDELPAGSPVLLGAQDAHWAPEGAHTGAVSMAMVADAGASLVEIGHSERRRGFGETDAIVARKVRAALAAGLAPLVCLGEDAGDRAAGRELDVVTAQLAAALADVAPAEVGQVLLAYEPVWAIGESGTPATADQVAGIPAALRAAAADSGAGGTGVRALLYGGSVDASNAAELLAVPGVDGLFVGRAAWRVEGLLELVAVAAGERAGAGERAAVPAGGRVGGTA